jgi:hypothetical protein
METSRSAFRKTFRDRQRIAEQLPRLWMILAVLVLPFLTFSYGYFESLERTGPIGAFVVNTMFSAVLAGYPVLVYLLKQRRI